MVRPSSMWIASAYQKPPRRTRRHFEGLRMLSERGAIPAKVLPMSRRGGRLSNTSRCRTGGAASRRRARSRAKSAEMPDDQPTSASAMRSTGSTGSPGRKRQRSLTRPASMISSKGRAASSIAQPDMQASVQYASALQGFAMSVWQRKTRPLATNSSARSACEKRANLWRLRATKR